MYEKREMRSSTWGGVGAKVIVSNGNKSVVVTIPKYTSLTG